MCSKGEKPYLTSFIIHDTSELSTNYSRHINVFDIYVLLMIHYSFLIIHVLPENLQHHVH